MTGTTLYRLTLPYLCAGVECRGAAQTVVRAAPILAWCQGRPVAVLAAYAKRKGGTLERLGEDR